MRGLSEQAEQNGLCLMSAHDKGSKSLCTSPSLTGSIVDLGEDKNFMLMM